VKYRSLSEVYSATLPGCIRLAIASSVVLCALGLALVPYRDDILGSLLGLFIPEDWLASWQMANAALFHQVGNALLFQTVAILCFSTVSVFFFIPRDRISTLSEETMTGRASPDNALIRELWLEAGLVMIAFNVYSATYLAAYFIGQPLFTYIDELAFVLLMLFFAVDLLSPTHFRRNLNSLWVFAAIRQRPVAVLLFAVAFCSPIYALELYLGDLVYYQQDTGVLAAALAAIIVLNCIVCVFALPLGTWLAVSTLTQRSEVPRQGVGLLRHKAFYLANLVVMLALLFFYGSLVGVLASKVPLKSAEYAIQWRTIEYQEGVEGGAPGLRFLLRVSNHHERLGLEVDNANLLLNIDGRYLGEAALDIPYVAPGSVVDVPVELKMKLAFSELAGIAVNEVLGYFTGQQPAWRENLQARLMVRLPLGLELPLYITEGYRHEFAEE
jgi:hypothetical protein